MFEAHRLLGHFLVFSYTPFLCFFIFFSLTSFIGLGVLEETVAQRATSLWYSTLESSGPWGGLYQVTGMTGKHW